MSNQGQEHEEEGATASQPLENTGEAERSERTEHQRAKGGGRNRGKGQSRAAGGHGGGGWGNWKSQGGSKSHRPILILGDPPQARLKEASHLKSPVEHCVLCHEERPSYVGIGRCRHAEVCWICTLRLRFLNQDTRCPLCNEELMEVLLTSDRSASVEPMDFIGLNHEDPWIYFADDIIRRAVLQLLGYRCQIEGCAKKDVAFRTLTKLENHLWEAHWRQLCKVCLQDRSAFICEQRVYAHDDMNRHNWEGDTSNMMVQQQAMPTVPPHPRCEFCNQRFFNEETLLAHVYRRHVLCQLCDSLGLKNEFYLNLKCLSRHYQEKHYVCAHKDCAQGGYRQTAFAHEEALIEHYEMVHKQSFKDEKGKRQVVGLFDEEPSRRRKGSGRGSASGDDDPVQFRWPSTAEPQDYTTEADNEDQGDYNRYPNRDIVPLTRVDKGGSWRPTGKAEEGHPEDAQAEERKEEQEEEEEQGDAAKAQRDPTSAEEALHPALERLSFDCAMAKEGPRSGAPSCLSALHSALRALVTESEAEAEGWDVKLLPAIRKLNRAEVENLECMRIYLHDPESQDQEHSEDSIDWEPLERLLGLRPMLYLLQATKAKQPSNSRSRQAIGPRQGQAEDEEEITGWRKWKMRAQAVILSLAPKAQQRLLRFVELCVQRRTALEQIDEGVPDWEDENIGQVFPSLSDSASGNAVASAQPEMGSLARHARGWADIASGHGREANATTAEQFPALGGGSAVSARPSWGPPRGPALPSGEPRNVNGHAGPREAPKNEVVQKEAFPSLGGGGIVNENVKWGAPASTMNGQPDSKEGSSSPKREMTLEEWAKPKAAARQPQEFNAESSESFPTLGGGGSRAPAVPTWGARNVTVSHSTQAAKAAAAKEAKVVAAAKEAAEAIAEAKAARSSKDEKDQKEKAQVVEVQVVCAPVMKLGWVYINNYALACARGC
ncbi:unnamed protein product [Durusdinium trenchii]|uniref:RING-type domain-containing protein n=1 Tax=Durusdinium trenchii TaxID=1381693 RepID=A0ABP0LVC5_9DINO